MIIFAHTSRFIESPRSSSIVVTLPTTTNDLVAPIHDRMPVILHPQDYDLWLDPNFHQIERLQTLLQPYPATQMSAHPVSTIVNSPKNNAPECQESL
jgi:putative SOS response-associated peptidase YedK